MAVSPAVIKKTQDSLGKYIKKPPLTEKLLTKPPFRFLHDVFSIAMRETGVLEGLFEESELDSSKVKEKDAKVQYLTKIIDCLSIATETTLQVKPGKIVSGQEAEKTNLLLQALATAIQNNIDTSDAVKRVRNGEKPGKPKKSAKKTEDAKAVKKGGSADRKDRENKENRANNQRSAQRSAVPKQNSKESPKKIKPRSPSPQQERLNIEDERLADEVNHQREAEDGEEEDKSIPPQINGHADQEEIVPVVGNIAAEESDQLTPTRGPSARPPSSFRSAGSPDRRIPSARSPQPPPQPPPEPDPDPEVFGGQGEDEPPSVAPTTRPTTAARPGSSRPKTGRLRSARPPSARPAAPRIRERKDVPVEEQPRPVTAKVANLILDTEADEDDAEEFLIEEAAKDPLDSLDLQPASDEVPMETSGKEHGGLVQQILETQKELQDGNKIQKGVEIEREAGVGEVGRNRDREGTKREVDKLRNSIQTLTRSANPLGKLMDFLQEDVDSMQRELDSWREENKQLQLQLRHEETLTQETLQPLSEHLKELTAAVDDQLDKISVVKSNILRNEEKISKMVGSIGVSQR